MNAIEQIIEESIKISKNNQDILLAIKTKSKELMIEDLFEITKLFVAKKGKNVAQSFTIKEFEENDPEGYFNKIVKGFCRTLVDISQEELLQEEKDKILTILENRKSFETNK